MISTLVALVVFAGLFAIFGTWGLADGEEAHGCGACEARDCGSCPLDRS
jgi:hypothetical protein